MWLNFLILKYFLINFGGPKTFKIFGNCYLTSHRRSFLLKKFVIVEFIFVILLQNFSKINSYRNYFCLLPFIFFWLFLIIIFLYDFFLDFKIINLNYTFVLLLDFFLNIFNDYLDSWNLLNTFCYNTYCLVFNIIFNNY